MKHIYYEDVEKNKLFKEKFEQLLEEYETIKYHINGIVIILHQGMNYDDIETEVAKSEQYFEKNKVEIKLEENESIYHFSERIANLANKNNTCYCALYHNHLIKAVPGTNQYNILLQIVSINKEYLTTLENGYKDVKCNAGYDYMEFGHQIYYMLKNDDKQNIMANFNSISIPFTADMANHVWYGDNKNRGVEEYNKSDVYAFAMMFGAMLRGKYAADNLFDYLEEKEKNKHTI